MSKSSSELAALPKKSFLVNRKSFLSLIQDLPYKAAKRKTLIKYSIQDADEVVIIDKKDDNISKNEKKKKMTKKKDDDDDDKHHHMIGDEVVDNRDISQLSINKTLNNGASRHQNQVVHDKHDRKHHHDKHHHDHDHDDDEDDDMESTAVKDIAQILYREDSTLRDDEDDFVDINLDLIRQVGLRELQKGEKYNAYEQQKLYAYIVEKDCKMLRDKDAYNNANAKYTKKRQHDAAYLSITGARDLGSHGDFNEVDVATSYHRWKLTSQPYGEVAHRHYTRWRDSIIEGMKGVFVQEQEQVRQVRTLWDDIRFHRDTAVEQQIEQEALNRLHRGVLSKTATEQQRQQEEEAVRDTYDHIIAAGDFQLLHRSVQQLDPDHDYRKQEMQWDKGFHADFDINQGFPKPAATHVESSKSGVMKNTLRFQGKTSSPSSSLSSQLLMRKREFDGQYDDWMNAKGLASLEQHLIIEDKKKHDSLIQAQRRTSTQIIMRRQSLIMNSGDINIVQQQPSSSSPVVPPLLLPTMPSSSSSHIISNHHINKRLSVIIPQDDDHKISSSSSSLLTPSSSPDAKAKHHHIHASSPSSSYLQPSSPTRNIVRHSSSSSSKVKHHHHHTNDDNDDDDAMLRMSFDSPTKRKSPTHTLSSKPHILSSIRTLFTHMIIKPSSSSSSSMMNMSSSSIIIPTITEDKDIIPTSSSSSPKLRDYHHIKNPDDIFLSDDDITNALKPSPSFAPMTWIIDAISHDSNDRRSYHHQQHHDDDKNRINLILRENRHDDDVKDEMMLVELLLRVRRRVMDRKALYCDLKERITKKYDDRKLYYADDLINACREGSYHEVINILDHHNQTVGPNDSNEKGESALYVALAMVLNNESYPLAIGIGEFSPVAILSNARLRKSELRKHHWTNIEIIILVLLHFGGDVDYVRQGGDGHENRAIMHLAAGSNDVTMLSWLCSRGARTSTLSSYKRTPLSVAAERDYLPAVLFLIRHGAIKSIDIQDNQGWTALHYAAAYASMDLVKVLLVCGANTKMKSVDGYRPFEEAQRHGRSAVVDMLRRHKDTMLPHQKRLQYLDSVYANYETPSAMSSKISK